MSSKDEILDEEIETIEYKSESESELEQNIDEPTNPMFQLPRDVTLQTVTWDGGYGLRATEAEGELGEKLRKISRITRTPEEKFRDNLVKILTELDVPRSLGNMIQQRIGMIPDIAYKNPAGVLFGFQLRNMIDKKVLTKEDKQVWSNIKSQIELLKTKNYKIDDLTIIRYARLLKDLK